MQSEAYSSPQHFGETREALLMLFMGRGVTSRRLKCVQVPHPCWTEWGDSVQGIGWEGVGRDGKEPSPLGPFLPLVQTLCSFAGTAILGAGHENGLSKLFFCKDFNCAVVLLHKLFLADRESGWNFRELHLPPASTAELSSLLGAALHHRSLCIRSTHSRTLTSAGCSCNTDFRQP